MLWHLKFPCVLVVVCFFYFVASPILNSYPYFYCAINANSILSLQQWASLYQPLTFTSEASLVDPAGDSHLNKLDPTKAFRGKAKTPVPKKKQSTQCTLGSTAKSVAGKHTGPKRWKYSQLIATLHLLIILYSDHRMEELSPGHWLAGLGCLYTPGNSFFFKLLECCVSLHNWCYPRLDKRERLSISAHN